MPKLSIRMFVHVCVWAKALARCLFVCGSLRIPRNVLFRNLLTSILTHKQTHTHTRTDRHTGRATGRASRTRVSTVDWSALSKVYQVLLRFFSHCFSALSSWRLKLIFTYIQSFTWVLNYVRVPSDRFFVHIDKDNGKHLKTFDKGLTNRWSNLKMGIIKSIFC